MSESFFLVDPAGQPLGTVDLDQIADDAVLLMFQLAASTHDAREIDGILLDWTRKLDRDSLRLVVVSALAQMSKSIVEPLLVMQETVHPSHRSRAHFAQQRDRIETARSV